MTFQPGGNLLKPSITWIDRIDASGPLEEVAAKQFRQLKRSLQDEQLELKSRIAELRAELRAVESELSHHAPPGRREMHIEVEPATQGSAPPQTPPSPVPADEVVDESGGGVLADKLAALEASEGELSGEESGDEYAQAMKRFRRRA